MELTVSRWGNPEGDPYTEISFGMRVEEEKTYGGLIIPLRVGSAGGTEPTDG